jgi:hypothetical protein
MNSEDRLEILNTLRVQGFLEYGSRISGTVLRSLFGVETPTDSDFAEMTRKEFEKAVTKAALEELTAVDFIRKILLSEGKYFDKQGNDYRIALPSENSYFIGQYMKAAKGKINRAEKLRTSTPVESHVVTNVGSRLLLADKRTNRLTQPIN